MSPWLASECPPLGCLVPYLRYVGKTTFLECLALRNMSFKGAIHWNGKAVNGRYYNELGGLPSLYLALDAWPHIM